MGMRTLAIRVSMAHAGGEQSHEEHGDAEAQAALLAPPCHCLSPRPLICRLLDLAMPKV